MKNFIPISRKIFNHPFWEERREYSRFEAWLDLVRSASFQDGQEKIIKGSVIRYNRGQYPASLSFLSQRWGWSVGKVRHFLQQLVFSTMISKDSTQNTTVITICKYDSYNGELQKNNTDSAQLATSLQQQSKQDKEPNNEEYLRAELISSHKYLEGVAKAYGMTIGWVTNALDRFLLDPKEHNDLNDIKRHFVNWLNKNKPQQQEQKTYAEMTDEERIRCKKGERIYK